MVEVYNKHTTSLSWRLLLTNPFHPRKMKKKKLIPAYNQNVINSDNEAYLFSY